MTLPPPEWTVPSAPGKEAAIVASGVSRALERRDSANRRADEAALRGALEAARRSSDHEAFWEVATTLARGLAASERGLDEAVNLAAEAFALRPADVELGRELARWLESLGEPTRAAQVLETMARALLEGTNAHEERAREPEVVEALVRAGTLRARAGQASEAAHALEEAMRLDPEGAIAAELYATLACWAPEIVPPAEAARAYADATARRAGSGAPDAEMDNALRAFAADPSSGVAASALASRLPDDAADEIWRGHGAACAQAAPQRAAQVHAKRRASAMEAGDWVRALGAALDERLDRVFDGEAAETFHGLLAHNGLLEALAARLEVRAVRTEGTERARVLAELTRLYAGPLADTERAAEAYVEAVVADPGAEDTLAGLAAYEPSSPSARLRYDPGNPRAALTSLDAPSVSRGAASAAWVSASLLGSPLDEARALSALSASCAPPLRSLLLAQAAERYMEAGARGEARHAAERACQADPSSARAIATLADVVSASTEGEGLPSSTERRTTTRPLVSVALTGDRMAAMALERAIGAVCARPAWCAALAQALEGFGQDEHAVAWTQRYVALRPGDPSGVVALVQRVARTGDPGRLADSVAWALSQPVPLSTISRPIVEALGDLAMLDRDRAAALARRVLDVLGARDPVVRATLLAVADDAGDTALAAAVLERCRAAAALDGESPGLTRKELVEILTSLVGCLARLGDADGEARALVSLARAGGPAALIEERVQALSSHVSADGEIWLLEARAALHLSEEDPHIVTEAWRELGAALWDLAGDYDGAVRAWLRAARCAPTRGFATLGDDLRQFAPPKEAFDRLVGLMAEAEHEAESGALAVEAARAALAIGDARRAFELAVLGMTRNPAAVRALEIVERATILCGTHAELSVVYDGMADRALGRFGRRAAHYRGARFFEQQGERALALKHAAQAFMAAPAEGATFVMLARAAERAEDPAVAVRAVEQVAEETPDPAGRAAWLLRAASLAGDDRDGLRRRVDLLLRALALAPHLETLAKLGEAARALLELLPDEREALELRVERARRALTEGLEGPDGARVALAFVDLSLDLFGDVNGALASVQRAVEASADLDEYALLVRHAPVFALASGASAFVASLLEKAEDPLVNVGPEALRLAGAIANDQGDAYASGRAAVLAACRAPEDDALVLEADAAVRTLGDASLAERLAAKVSAERRAEALRAWARERAQEGAYAEAAMGLERAAELTTGELREDIDRELRAANEAAGRPSDLEVRAEREATNDETSAPFRAARWAEVAERREQRRDYAGAVRALQEAARLDPEPTERWSALERVAELAGDAQTRVAALLEILTRVKEEGRVAVHRRLARAYEAAGDHAAAEATWRRVLEDEPDDEEADQAIEALIAGQGRYEELAEHLARRGDRLTGQSGARETLRALRLRRAAILEQRLDRIQDACHELTLLLAEWPENASALRYLADLYERMGQHAKAAPLWRRAAALEAKPTARDELEIRAAKASASAGDVALAHAHLRAVLARNPTSHAALTLRIELARAAGDERELGEALEALADTAVAEPETRCDLLVEAAQAAWRLGDAALALSRAQQAVAAAPERPGGQFLARGLEYRLRGAGAPDEARRTLEELGKIQGDLSSEERALRAFLCAEALDVVQGGAAGMRELRNAQAEVGDHPLIAMGIAERLVAQGNHEEALTYFERAIDGDLLGLRPPGSAALAATDAALRIGAYDRAHYFLAMASREPEAQSAAALRAAKLAELEAGERQDDAAEPLRAEPTGFHHEDEALEEQRLWQALADGDMEAGDELAKRLADRPDRARDLVQVRLQQLEFLPGDPEYLDALRAAAEASGDGPHARAIEHVQRAFDPDAGPLAPPTLADQSPHPGLLAMLTKPSDHPLAHALARVWEEATSLFVRDPVRYGVSGLERVSPGGGSALSRVYESALLLLDLPRIPLYVPRAVGPLSAAVALLAPPSVLLTGDVREDTPELRFVLGRGLAAALPASCLLLGLPPKEAAAVTAAVCGAFGPPELGRTVDATSGRLAESLWQVVPPRAQRELRDVLGAAPLLDHARAVERAHQCGRRVGLFLSGSFTVAAGTVLAEHGVDAASLATPGALRDLCGEIPALGDLFRLAVSPQYAAARWQPVPASSRRGMLSASRVSPA